MGSVANLAVSISARVGSFYKGLQGAQRAVGRFARDVRGSASSVYGFGAAVVGAATTGGLALFVRNSMQSIDAIADQADMLGLSTEKLIAYQHAANLAGSSSEAMTKGLTIFSRVVGTTVTGASSAAIPAFNALGISIEQLRTQPISEIFERASSSIGKIQNESVRSAVAMALFGKSGAELGNVFANNTDKFAGARAEVEKLGVAFSRVDAEKVAQANDAIDRMGLLFTGIGQQLAIHVAPMIENLATRFVDTGSAGLAAGNTVGRSFNNAVMAVAKMADFLELIRAGWNGFRGAVETASSGILQLLAMINDGYLKLVQSIGDSKLGKLLAEHLDIDFAGGSDAIAKVSDELRSAAKVADEKASASFDQMGKSFEAFTTGANQKAVGEFFDTVAQKAQKSAEAVAKAKQHAKGMAGADAVPNLSTAAPKTSDFRQIDLRRIALGGLGGVRGEQRVKDPQLKDVISLLRSLNANTSDMAAVTS